MVGVVNPTTRRLRYFALLTIPVFIITQALTQTALTKQSPEVNSENLLVLLTPLFVVYGTGLFFMLLDQLVLPMVEARYAVISAFVVLTTLPMTFVFLGPRLQPIAFPPYYPPGIQLLSSWLKEKEMLMTDIPWATAWYGNRQSIWLTQCVEPDPKTLPKREDFFAVNDFLKPVNILYLSPETMDRKFISDWAQGEEKSWGALVIQTVVQKEVPDTFPLRKSLPGWLPQQLLLADWERWRAPQ
jgi:hypothetical protein